MKGFACRIGVVGCLLAVAASPPPGSPAARFQAAERLYPPWQGGTNDGARKQGLIVTLPPVDSASDFHGDVNDPALVIYAAGNYFFAMPGLIGAFTAANPSLAGHVFYETLPPSMLIEQMDAGGTATTGNLTFTVPPDVLMAVQGASERWVSEGRVIRPVVPFATNDLAIMVPAGNPGQIAGLADLGRADVPIAMPEAAAGGIAVQIRAALVKAGGKALDTAVYDQKVGDGTNVLMVIHHRQTPLALMQGVAVAGVTWTSEALFQEQAGHPITHVPIPDAQNVRAVYTATAVKEAPHGQAAAAWLAFLRTDAAFDVLARYGFQRPPS